MVVNCLVSIRGDVSVVACKKVVVMSFHDTPIAGWPLYECPTMTSLLREELH